MACHGNRFVAVRKKKPQAQDRLDCVAGRAVNQMPAAREVVDETAIAEWAAEVAHSRGTLFSSATSMSSHIGRPLGVAVDYAAAQWNRFVAELTDRSP